MNADIDGRPWGSCAAYACPLFGSMGSEGKWFCFCHFNADPSLNDAITAELHRQKPLVDRVVADRRAHSANAALEDQLHNIIREIGHQASIPTAPVTGPTYAAQHYSEPA